MQRSTSHNRWIIEADDIYWEAPINSGDGPICVPEYEGYNIASSSLNPTVCAEFTTSAACMSSTWVAIDETEVIEGTTDEHPEKTGVCAWVEGDRRQSQSI